MLHRDFVTMDLDGKRLTLGGESFRVGGDFKLTAATDEVWHTVWTGGFIFQERKFF